MYTRKNQNRPEKKQSAIAALKVLEMNGAVATMRKVAKLMHYAPSSAMLDLLWEMAEEGTIEAEVLPYGNGKCKTKTVFRLKVSKKGAQSEKPETVYALLI